MYVSMYVCKYVCMYVCKKTLIYDFDYRQSEESSEGVEVEQIFGNRQEA